MYVRNNEVLHERIMRALRFQKGKEEITIRIDRWFEAQTWESVEQELEQIRKKVYGQDEI
jgi:ribonuclease HIII